MLCTTVTGGFNRKATTGGAFNLNLIIVISVELEVPERYGEMLGG